MVSLPINCVKDCGLCDQGILTDSGIDQAGRYFFPKEDTYTRHPNIPTRDSQ